MLLLAADDEVEDVDGGWEDEDVDEGDAADWFVVVVNEVFMFVEVFRCDVL